MPLPEDHEFTQSPSARTGIRYRVFPGLDAGLVDRTSAANIVSLTSWFRDRARRLLPGQSVERVEIRWFEDKFQNQEGNLAMVRRPAGAFVVPLEGVNP
jgi:hypothetical protein